MAVNPIIILKPGMLYDGEQIAPLNQYAIAGCVINPYYYVTTYGRYFSIYSGQFVEKSFNRDGDGYLELQVSTNVGMKHLRAHRGILATFAPTYNMHELEVEHKDGNHANNTLSNLMWVTHVENVRYAHENNLIPRIDRRIVNDNDIICIMRFAKEGYDDEEISDILSDLNIAPATIRHIRTGADIYGEILARLGLDPVLKKQHRNPTEDDYKKVEELMNQGLKSIDISRVTGINSRTVRNMMQKIKGTYVIKKNPTRFINPIAMIPAEYQNNIHMVNIYTSPLHVINPIYAVTMDGKVLSMSRGKWLELSPYYNSKGYAAVTLATNHGPKAYFVHRLVMAAFDPVPNMYDLEVNHKNANHGDNNISNLEWTTRAENMEHAAKHVINQKPQRAPDEDIIKIINLANEGKTDEEISNAMEGEYSPYNVRIIRSGLKTYGPVLKQLGLEPYKRASGHRDPELKKKVYQYIKDREGTKMLKDLYEDAAREFNIPYATIHNIYFQGNHNWK